jgi:DNA-binding CsgD family transcriptional regulator
MKIFFEQPKKLGSKT